MKINRLIRILAVLLHQEKVTAPVLAEKFEVSRRTINRDIEGSCKAGVPVGDNARAKRRHFHYGGLPDRPDTVHFVRYASNFSRFAKAWIACAAQTVISS